MKTVYKIILIFLKDKDDKESQVSATELLDKPDPAGGNVKFSKQGNVFSFGILIYIKVYLKQILKIFILFVSDTEKNDSANTSSTSLDEGTGPFSQQGQCIFISCVNSFRFKFIMFSLSFLDMFILLKCRRMSA
jgi:hypothetical protein